MTWRCFHVSPAVSVIVNVFVPNPCFADTNTRIISLVFVVERVTESVATFVEFADTLPSIVLVVVFRAIASCIELATVTPDHVKLVDRLFTAVVFNIYAAVPHEKPVVGLACTKLYDGVIGVVCILPVFISSIIVTPSIAILAA